MHGRYALRSVEGFLSQHISMLAGKIVEGGALYANPRPIENDSVSAMLMDAYVGRRPSVASTRTTAMMCGATGPHASLETSLAGCPLEEAEACIVCVHGRYSSSDRMIYMLENALGS